MHDEPRDPRGELRYTRELVRVLELYAGIGGCASALEGAHSIVAIEQSDWAVAVYRANHAHPVLHRNLAGIGVAELEAAAADLWWLSPPCQSFTRRGGRRDVEDTRAHSFLRVLEPLAQIRPRAIALENVPGFVGSRAQELLRERLAGGGYHVRERVLCPTELGIPNRRERYYLVASRDPLPDWPAAPHVQRKLADYLDPAAFEDPSLVIAEDVVADYCWAMQILEPEDPTAIANCFTSAYGRSRVRSGAFLYACGRVRMFSPREILALLGFSRGFVFPENVPRERTYGLIGNSLSIDAVREVLRIVPGLDTLKAGWMTA